MHHTVRLCRDLTGWFATLCDDMPGYPGTRVHWQAAFKSHDHALSILDLAETLAQRLDGEAFPSWTPQVERAPSPEALCGRPLAGGPSWASRHYEAGRFLVMVEVSQDRNGLGVRLTDSGGHSEAVIYYSTRRMAMEVAGALVRIRHRVHVCGAACSGWAEDASSPSAWSRIAGSFSKSPDAPKTSRRQT